MTNKTEYPKLAKLKKSGRFYIFQDENTATRIPEKDDIKQVVHTNRTSIQWQDWEVVSKKKENAVLKEKLLDLVTVPNIRLSETSYKTLQDLTKFLDNNGALEEYYKSIRDSGYRSIEEIVIRNPKEALIFRGRDKERPNFWRQMSCIWTCRCIESKINYTSMLKILKKAAKSEEKLPLRAIRKALTEEVMNKKLRGSNYELFGYRDVIFRIFTTIEKRIYKKTEKDELIRNLIKEIEKRNIYQTTYQPLYHIHSTGVNRKEEDCDVCDSELVYYM